MFLIVSALVLYWPKPDCNETNTCPLEEESLQIMGAIDDRPEFQAFLQKMYSNNESFNISYLEGNIETYEEDLIDLMTSTTATAPDIFLIKNSWLPRFKNKLAPAPASDMDYNKFSELFVDVAVNDFVSDSKVYGVPLYVDNLALYWNKDLFSNAGISQPPKNWDEFLTDALKMTKKESISIIQSGVAMGGVENINHSVDILYTLMMQLGTAMNEKKGQPRVYFMNDNSDLKSRVTSESQYSPAASALRFYTDFSIPEKESYMWNSLQHYSVDLFSEGKLAMMFDYSYVYEDIKKKNPYLNFGIAQMPQPKDVSKATTFADYWGFVVWGGSANKNAAWKLLKTFTEEPFQKAYIEKFERPAALRSLIDYQKSIRDMGVFGVQALWASSWYQINDVKIRTIMEDTIKSVANKTDTSFRAMQKAEDKINSLIKR